MGLLDFEKTADIMMLHAAVERRLVKMGIVRPRVLGGGDYSVSEFSCSCLSSHDTRPTKWVKTKAKMALIVVQRLGTVSMRRSSQCSPEIVLSTFNIALAIQGIFRKNIPS